MTKRLFIFAAYDKDSIIDNSLLYYLQALSKLGDIVFYMDNNLTVSEIAKIGEIPNVLHAAATHHGEYDFGSYKRGYAWAAENDILKNYDWVYLVNDSVYGPLRDLRPILEDLENRGADAVGMIKLHEGKYEELNMQFGLTLWKEHIQSWFVGVTKNIFTSPWFAEFLNGIKHQENKLDIVLKYEAGLSELIAANGFKLTTWEEKITGSEVYNMAIRLMQRGMPFIKKLSLFQINNLPRVMRYAPKALRKHLAENAKRCDLCETWDTVWRIKLWRITLLKYERANPRLDRNKYRLSILKLIPVTVYKYNAWNGCDGEK